ncbi:hypothetical protein BDV96DRAFT_584743 [Lophiotrema nucula]|uniref:Uncharacterized protein n=1 Tax=Lophiotrema nucula TaxID=690887 RepID=A0A6A5YT19_9PLEO|nr:hypothetical protein BDV96DRAFT_584743 [Lophiotrema nucula]
MGKGKRKQKNKKITMQQPKDRTLELEEAFKRVKSECQHICNTVTELPRELRDMVYSHLYADGHQVNI